MKTNTIKRLQWSFQKKYLGFLLKSIKKNFKGQKCV